MLNLKEIKNLFDKSTLEQGDIIDAFPTLRITSRQAIWLESGTYTASTNLSLTYQWGIQIQNVGTLPLSSYPTYIYETGWQTAGTTEKTFTIKDITSSAFIVNYNDFK